MKIYKWKNKKHFKETKKFQTKIHNLLWLFVYDSKLFTLELNYCPIPKIVMTNLMIDFILTWNWNEWICCCWPVIVHANNPKKKVFNALSLHARRKMIYELRFHQQPENKRWILSIQISKVIYVQLDLNHWSKKNKKKRKSVLKKCLITKTKAEKKL